jgi:hypothetical protein
MNNFIHHLMETQRYFYSVPVIDHREKNIKHIFVHTEHWMEDIEQKYDYIFFRLCYRSKGRHSMEVLHERALQLTIRLLN